jgi:AraC-like DNA-binding protein
MRVAVLYEDPDVTLARYDHPEEDVHADPEREEAEGHAVSFLERGTFRVHRGREAWRLERGSVFVTRPGFRYRCTHDSATPDDVCLSVSCSGEILEEAAKPWRAFVPVVPLTNRLAFLHHELGRAVEDGVAPMAVPILARQIVGALSVRGRKLHRPGQLAWYAERVREARDLMARRYAEPLSIATLGREVGMSPFHLSRVFHELVGEPPHRHLVRLRLDRAARALREGRSVTQASLDAGFPNLGHFIRRFRRAYGVPPSRWGRRDSLPLPEK